jgi:acyl-CoA thioester hydrolase
MPSSHLDPLVGEVLETRATEPEDRIRHRASPIGSASLTGVQRDFEHPLRVRYGECDPQGIVFNANYLLYFDVVFTELWREALGPWQELKDSGVDLVVANANIDFRTSARFDDELVLVARIARLGTTSIASEFDVMRDGELLVAGRLVHV